MLLNNTEDLIALVNEIVIQFALKICISSALCFSVPFMAIKHIKILKTSSYNVYIVCKNYDMSNEYQKCKAAFMSFAL